MSVGWEISSRHMESSPLKHITEHTLNSAPGRLASKPLRVLAICRADATQIIGYEDLHKGQGTDKRRSEHVDHIVWTLQVCAPTYIVMGMGIAALKGFSLVVSPRCE